MIWEGGELFFYPPRVWEGEALEKSVRDEFIFKKKGLRGSVELAGRKGEAILDFACVSEECMEMSGRNRK